MTFRHTSSRRLVLLLGATVVAATVVGSCEKPTTVTAPPSGVARVEVAPPSATVEVGQTAQVTAIPTDATGALLSDRVVMWSSSDTGVATANGSGFVTGVAAGSATITATSEGKSGMAAVTVVQPPPPGCTMSSATWQNAAFASQAAAFGAAFDATPNVANMDGGTGLSTGTAGSFADLAVIVRFDSAGLIDARNGGAYTAASAIPYTVGTSYHFRLVVDPPSHTYSAYVTPAGGTEVTLGTNYAFRTEQSTVTTLANWALRAGVGSHTVCNFAIGGTAPPAPVATVTVTPESATVSEGKTVQLTATLKDAAGNVLTGRTVMWMSNNTGLATVNGRGLVTGVTAGSATITATSEGQTGTAAITVVHVPVASVTVTPAPASVNEGKTVQLVATPKDAAGNVLTGRAVAWASGNAAVATVSTSGLVTGKVAGTATITATSEGQSGTSAVTVVHVAVASVEVSPATASIVVGGTAQLTAIPKDAAGNSLTGRTVMWASNNPAVATVSGSGLVTGGAAGSASITATSEGQSGSAAVTVMASNGSIVTDAGRVFTEPSVSKPGYLAPVVLAPFGTTVQRVVGDPGTSIALSSGTGTWGSDARHHYSKDQPWSADGTLLAVQNRSGGTPDVVFLDGATYRPKFGRCGGLSGDDRWHPSPAHAHERIAVPGSELMWFDVVTCTKTRSWTLPFSVTGLGASEGNPSVDGRFVALANASQMFVVDMDPQSPFAPYPNKRIGPAVALPASVDWVTISPSGKYAVAQVSSGPAQVFDVDPATLALTPRPMPAVYPGCGGTASGGWIYNVGHADLTLDPFDNNEDVIVGRENCGNRGKVVGGQLVGKVVSVRLRDGVMRSLTDPTNEADPRHVSTRSYDRPGWAYVSYYPQPGARFSDEIVAVKLDGSGAVERLAHMHSDANGCYRCEPHAVPSRDGLRVLWASNWMINGAGTGSATLTQGYVVDTRLNR